MSLSEIRPAASPRPSRSITLSFEGTVWFIAVFLLLTVGISKNINLLSLLGCMMACLLGLNLLLPLLRVHFGESSIRIQGTPVAGIRHPVEILLRPKIGLAQYFQVTLEGPWGPATLWSVVGLKPGPVFLHGMWMPQKRGLAKLGPLFAYSRYPFGLATASLDLRGATTTLVHPATGSIHWEVLLRRIPWQPRDRRDNIVGNRLSKHKPHAREEFHAMRGFRPGDSPRLIHWRTTARRGYLIVREFEDPPDRELVLEFDPLETVEKDREQAISFVATFIHGWFQQGHGRLALRFAGETPLYLACLSDAGGLNRALDWLASWSAGPVHWPSGGHKAGEGPPVLRVSSQALNATDKGRRSALIAVDVGDPNSLDFWRPVWEEGK
jgi:uncharacterized protein (DUF58 family)